MVVHGTDHFLHYRMNLGVRMLCNVAFRQFPQIEDVAKLGLNGYGLGFGFGAGLSTGLGFGSQFGWLFGFGTVFGSFVCYRLYTDLVDAEVLEC